MKKILLIIIITLIIGAIAFVSKAFSPKEDFQTQNQTNLKDYWPINNWLFERKWQRII